LSGSVGELKHVTISRGGKEIHTTVVVANLL
jgi:hypothetical protein